MLTLFRLLLPILIALVGAAFWLSRRLPHEPEAEPGSGDDA